jgi:putative intracellular protease/amidase
MANKVAYLYVLDTLADWEVGYITAELNTGRYFKTDAESYSVKTIGSAKSPVTTMGGLHIMPDYSIEEIRPENVGLFLLPVADLCHQPQHTTVLNLVKLCLDKGITVAAIYGATVALANAGILDQYKHTSNDLNFLLENCPNYKGSKNYMQQPVVTDNNLITATALAPLEFAKHILAKLHVFSDATLESWYQLHQTKKPEYFMQLMQSLPAAQE